MAISQTNYVDITSVVAGAAATGAPSLQHRRITSGALTKPDGQPTAPGEIVTVTYGMLEILNQVLGSSADRAFAQQYFSIKTTAPASKPKSLEFVHFDAAPTPTGSTLTGAVSDLDTLKTASGKSLTITTTKGTETVTIDDLSGAVDATALALIINGQMTAATDAQVIATGGVLQVTYAETGSTIDGILTASGEGAEILGLAKATGAETVIGGIVTAVDAYILSRQKSKNFGTFTIEGCKDLPQAELTKLKNYHGSYNVLHQLYIELDSKLGIAGLPVYQTFNNAAMTGFILSEAANQYKAVIPAGLIDATDFEGRNTVNQIMYRQASGMNADVDNDIDKLNLDSLLVNYYGETAVNATPLSFFQKGNLCGVTVDPRDMMVAACEQWIKGKVASDLINTQVASRIPANLDGKTRIRSMIINGAVSSALRSGAIIKLKDLTPLQREVILDMTGDELAAMDVFNNGYWLDVEIRTVVVDGIEEKHAYYTLIYSKADFVRKIQGSNNLI